MSIPYFSAESVREALPFLRAMRAIEVALLSEVDPEFDSPRLFSPAPDGEFLLLPAEGARFSGLKALTVAPENPSRGLDKIQGVYVLYDSDTLAPVAVMEGASLTAIRTPAVAITAVRALASIAPAGDELPRAPKVLVLGAGVQATCHIQAASAIFPDAIFEVVGRNTERVIAMRSKLAAEQIEVVDRSDSRDDAVAAADIILCATTSDTPLFDGSLVRGGAVVTAIGTHGKERREIDDGLVARADVVVEGRASAQRENGNLATAWDDDAWSSHPPANLRDLVFGRMKRRKGHPAFYTGVGMAWEDLVCASVVFEEGKPTT